MGLTKRAVDAFRWNPKGAPRQVLWDDGLPGFGVRVFESGAKSFVLSYRNADGTKRLATIGKYGVLTPDEARKKARTQLNRISDGADPVAAKKAGRAVLTMKDFAPLYIEMAKTVGTPGRKTRRPKKTWKEDQRRITKYIVPTFGSRPLASITKQDVVRLHTKIGATAKFEANRVLALLSVMLTSAVEMGHLPETFFNPTSRVTPFEEPSRARFVTHDEMPALIAAVNAEPSPYVRAFFWLRLMLGTRRTELLRARWEDVNLEQRTLYLPETKANRPHTLALAPEAVAILKTLPRMDGNPYVFPSPKKKRKGEPEEPMADVKRQWKRIRRTVTVDLWTAANPDRAAALRKQDDDDDTAYRAAVLQEVGGKLWDVRGHDLRRTVGSWAASSGESLVTIGSVLNHSDPSTTAIYARLTQNVQRTALENHATQLLAVAGVKPTI